MKDNFGIYFQLDGGKAVPFDHVENRTLNARGNRFEVIYRSYEPIDGSHVDLIAREHDSVYYKNNQGMRTRLVELSRRLILTESAVVFRRIFPNKKARG